MSVYEPESGRDATPSQLAADFLATFALFAGLIGIAVATATSRTS